LTLMPMYDLNILVKVHMRIFCRSADGPLSVSTVNRL
jgi:hypothetical protein